MKTLSFKQIKVKFFQPLTNHPIRTIIASVIIGIALYVGVDIGLAELARQNSYDIHILASELIIEHGPDYADESRKHAEMVQLYVDHLEERYLAAILRVLYPEYSPKKVLESQVQALRDTTTDEESKKAIRQAGLASNKLYILGKRFPRSPVEWFNSEDLSDRLLKYLDTAFAQSKMIVDKLEKNPNCEAAIEACRANRRAVLSLFLARLAYDNQKRIEAFRRDLERSRDCTRLLAKREEDKREQKFLYEVAESEDRRVKIVEAILANKIDSVCDLLEEAIQKFEKERGNTTVSCLESDRV